MFSLESVLSDSDRLALVAGNHADDEALPPMAETEIVSTARFPLPASILRGGVPVAPLGYVPDYDEGDEAPELADGEYDGEQERERAAYVLPSRRTRGNVARELRAMGYAWND